MRLFSLLLILTLAPVGAGADDGKDGKVCLPAAATYLFMKYTGCVEDLEDEMNAMLDGCAAGCGIPGTQACWDDCMAENAVSFGRFYVDQFRGCLGSAREGTKLLMQ